VDIASVETGHRLGGNPADDRPRREACLFVGLTKCPF
jgi:hypothetical protein